LCREVENLLDSFANAESFMEKSAAKEVASLYYFKRGLAQKSENRFASAGEMKSGVANSDIE